MRSGELCRLRPCDTDQSSDVWYYRPSEHKTTHHGKERVIPIGPLAQLILRPLLDGRKPDENVFSPARSEATRREAQSAARRTPRWPSHMKRNRLKRKRRPARAPKERFCPTSYARCIARACELAFPLPAELARRKVHDGHGPKRRETNLEWQARLGQAAWMTVLQWRKTHHWHPHQLRHLKATEVRARFGLDATQAILGHSEADVTQLYAQINIEKAADVARLTG